jgi:hypothetical protein
MIEAMALGLCLVDRIRLGKKYAVPKQNGTLRGHLTFILQNRLNEYQALAGPCRQNSRTVRSLRAPSTPHSPNQTSPALPSTNALEPLDPFQLMRSQTGQFCLNYLQEALQPISRTTRYGEYITISSTLPTSAPGATLCFIAITQDENGTCAVFTKGPTLRQACQGLVNLLPQKSISHSGAYALPHPNSLPPRERVTAVLVRTTEPDVPFIADDPACHPHPSNLYYHAHPTHNNAQSE